MPTSAPHDGVHVTRASNLAELEGSLEALAHQPRFNIACDLEEKGRAYFYDALHQCAYYLCGDNTDVLVWTWKPVETWWESAILRSLIETLGEPLTEATAREFRERATNRRPDWLIAAPQRRRAAPVVPFVAGFLRQCVRGLTSFVRALHAYALMLHRRLLGRPAPVCQTIPTGQ